MAETNDILEVAKMTISTSIKCNMNITVRQSRQSGVARATCPD